MLALLALPAWAQPVDPFEEPDESVLFRFEEQLVTVASRYAQTARKAPSIVDVVTADDIRERGYRTLSDILRDLPGIYVWKSPEGRDLAAFRGVVSSDNNKLLVLVDGLPWYEGVYTHGFIGDYLPVSHIKQVEVIKGPGSAIYGTNAFSGVVNIVTFTPGDLEGARIRWVAGGVGRSDLVATGGGRGQGRIRTAASAWARLFGQTGQGIELNPELKVDAPGTDPRKGVAGGLLLEVAGLRLQAQHVSFQHTYLFNEREDPFEALARQLDTFDLQYHSTFLDLRYALEPARDLTITPYAWLQRHRNPASYFFGGGITVDPTTFEATQSFITVDAEKDTQREGVGVDVQASPAVDHVVVAGGGMETVRVLRLFDLAFPTGGDPFVINDFAVTDDCGQPAGLYTNPQPCVPPRLRNLFAYAQYTWTAAPSLELTAGARVDKRVPMNAGERPDDGAFVLSVSPRLGVLVVPSDRVTGKLLYGRAFRAPAVRELLVTAAPDPTTGEYAFTSGNLELIPEKIQTVEGEVTAEVLRGVEVRADSSWSLLVDEIDKIDPGLYCNLPGDLQVVGAEAGVKANVGPATLDLGYALTMARYGDEVQLDRAICPFDWQDPYAGRQQYEFPPHMGKASLRMAFTDQVSATVFSELYDRRPRRAWSPDALNPDGAAFALVHLGVRAKELGPEQRVEVGLAVRNLLDSAWSTGVYRDDANENDQPAPVPGEGRSVLASFEVQI